MRMMTPQSGLHGNFPQPAVEAPAFLEWLFPAGCALCGRHLYFTGENRVGLCRKCHGGLQRNDGPRCIFCGRPLISELESCMVCREKKVHAVDRVFTIFPYSGKYSKILRAFKFGGNRNLAYFLAAELFYFISTNAKDEEIPEAWVPVPPRPGKLKSTGWDQLYYFSRRLKTCAERLKMESPLTELRPFYVFPCLKRLPSKSQKQLNREERAVNLKGRVIAVKKVPERVMLLDDVITTGATLDACAEALKANGAKTVYGLAFFYN